MPSDIENYLSQIRTAVYGRDVRDAIVNSIEQCYTDTSTGVTAATEAAATAADNTSAAINHMQTLFNALEAGVDGLMDTAEDAAATANAAAGTATTAAQNAQTVSTALSNNAQDIVLVQQNEPTNKPYNKVWVKPQVTEVEVPTYEEFSDLKSALNTVQDATIEIVEPINLLHGNWTQGYIINNQGVVTENSGYAYSDYFEVTPGTLICVTRAVTESTRGIMTETVAFYDANKTFIERKANNTRLVPDNAKYARQNMQISFLGYSIMVEITDEQETISPTYSNWFEPYINLKANYDANFHTKNLCVFGDSLAANGNGGDSAWINIVGNMLGFKNVYNRGIGATRVSATETRYAYVDADGDAYMRASYTTQQTISDYTEIDACMSSVDRANTIPTDTDVLIICAGHNDPSNVSAADFETAYKTMLDNIYERVPNARVLLGTLMYNHNWDAGEGASVYNNFRQKIRDIGALYGYPVIDFRADMMVNDLNWATYMDTDGVHYNTKQVGKNRVAETVIPEVLNIKYLE